MESITIAYRTEDNKYDFDWDTIERIEKDINTLDYTSVQIIKLICGKASGRAWEKKKKLNKKG